MKRFGKSLLTLMIITAFVACSQKKGLVEKELVEVYTGPRVTYAADIAPIMQRSCSPCHYPSENGKKQPFDTYAGVKDELNDILIRVQLPKDDKEFMPYKHKKQDLSAEEIEMLKNWARGGFLES